MSKVKLSNRDNELIESLAFNRDSKELETIHNSWGGGSCNLDTRGVALYDFVKGCEILELHTKHRKGLDLFRKIYPDEYMILLD